ncbi:MAG TPA: putative toxin-antitoxin system toxin component, PIN family [Mucilaginibacter sp.]
MRVVVDTNIVISAIINDKGKIGELLLYKPVDIHFSSPSFLLEELNIHTKKILTITGYSEPEFQQIKLLVISNIKFIDPGKIKKENWETSYNMLIGNDEKDTSFLALNMEINGFLWTGDKKLIKGLQNKNYDKVITTKVLYSKYFGL